VNGDDVEPIQRDVARLHDRWAGPLYVFAVRLVGDRETAEEVVQDTLVKVWRSADRFDPTQGSIETWVFTIARNCATDRLRRRAARPRTTAGIEQAPPVPSPSDVDRVLEAWVLGEALQTLSREHRQAIVEVHYRGRSVRETAELLDVPEGTVKSRVYYGLRALRLHLEERGVVA
jgi:RNA polymerase sigma-70 factor (ECF subfamily)